jgi:peptidyl-prolyl cis-trans isomerase A (cyclophilin A)
VQLQTSLGAIVLLVETGRAPITAANFLRYVDEKRLDGCGFYRAMTTGIDVELGLVQAGLRGNPKKSLQPIAHEPTTLTGLSHVDGALSMARAAPGTATADFFIVLGDLSSLDARPAAAGSAGRGDPGYAVFGRVIDGMDVVRAISRQPRSESATVEVMKGQMLEMPVRILTARRQSQRTSQ